MYSLFFYLCILTDSIIYSYANNKKQFYGNQKEKAKKKKLEEKLKM